MSEPRTFTYDSLTLRIPDDDRYYKDSAHVWCFLIEPSYEDELKTSKPIESTESVCFAFHYWMMKAFERRKKCGVNNDGFEFWEDLPTCNFYRWAMAWHELGEAT